MWMICLILSWAILLLAVITAMIAGHRGKLNAYNIFYAGMFGAVFVSLIPIYDLYVQGASAPVLRLILYTLRDTLRTFTTSLDIKDTVAAISASAGELASLYSIYELLLLFLAPLMTVGFIASFAKNNVAYTRFFLSRRKEMYLFCSLNEKSLALAADIRAEHKKAAIVFCDAFSAPQNLLQQAKTIRAICFKKELLSLRLGIHAQNKPLNIFILGEEHLETNSIAIRLLSRYGHLSRARLYVFCDRSEGELLPTSREYAMEVRCIDDATSLVYHHLYRRGEELFRHAAPADNGERHIHAMLIGQGRYGSEMLKALCWYGQMDGYRLTIEAFDKDPQALDRLCARCPELMDSAHNGADTPGEAAYRINVHAGVDVTTQQFIHMTNQLRDVTYILVALGSDSVNLQIATQLRMLYERLGAHPQIQTIVFNAEHNSSFNELKNFRGRSYEIELIGSLADTYSCEVMLNSELEQKALALHTRWGGESGFWRYDYYYRSSIASVIHHRACIACGIPGYGKAKDTLTDQEREAVMRLEHRRWNAYTRSLGYIYSGSRDPKSRDDLAKLHNSLVPFDQLSEEEKLHDLSVATAD